MRRQSNSRRRLKFALIAFSIGVIGGVWSLVDFSSFGGDVTGDRLQRVEASPHYRDGGFFNTVPQSAASVGLYWDYMVEQFFGDQVRVPPSAVPVVPFSVARAEAPPDAGLRAIWLGHASVYLELDGVRLLIDPMFSERASPVDFVGPKRFYAPPIALVALPKIDAVLISHDHYDHLDMATIQALAARGSQFFVPLGVGSE